MPQHAGHSSSTPDAPRPVCSWRLLLLVLLVLLPVTLALASPEHVHPAGESSGEPRIHAHAPSETPTCHHGGHQHAVPGLIADKRDLDVPHSGGDPDQESTATLSQGPTTTFTPEVASTSPERLSIHADHSLPVYLLTQRFRA